MTLGEHIMELRSVRGISQADLAEAMDVSRQSVSKWETGASTPDLEKLVKLADYFGLSLDQLVGGKGAEACEQSPAANAEDTRIETFPSAPKRTKAQSLGIFFLCLSAFSGIVFTILFGIGGVLFAAPFLLFGLICYVVKNHPILKAVWTNYMILSLYFHVCSASNPSLILLTFRWTYEMNYSILIFSWIWFLLAMALILGTAIIFRNKGWSWNRKCIGELVLALMLYVLGSVLGIFAGRFGGHTPFGYLLPGYLQLAGLTILLTDVTRWAVSRKSET